VDASGFSVLISTREIYPIDINPEATAISSGKIVDAIRGPSLGHDEGVGREKMPNIPFAVIGLGSAMMIMPGLSTLSTLIGLGAPRRRRAVLFGHNVDAVQPASERDLHAMLAKRSD